MKKNMKKMNENIENLSKKIEEENSTPVPAPRTSLRTAPTKPYRFNEGYSFTPTDGLSTKERFQNHLKVKPSGILRVKVKHHLEDLTSPLGRINLSARTLRWN